MANIANIIKEIRKRNNLTQTDFANLIGVSRSAIALIETNKNKPSEELAKKIATTFKVSEQELQILNNVGVNTGGNVGVSTNIANKKQDENEKIDLDSEIVDFLTSSYETLLNLDNYLETICSVLNAHTHYEFKKDDIQLLQKIRETRSIVIDLMFDRIIINNNHLKVIKSAISLGNELLDSYMLVLKNELGGIITDYNYLLPENT